jgi:hypothetical protein
MTIGRTMRSARVYGRCNVRPNIAITWYHIAPSTWNLIACEPRTRGLTVMTGELSVSLRDSTLVRDSTLTELARRGRQLWRVGKLVP